MTDSESRADPSPDDETHVTEITIQPDGRVYVFGLSRPVLELLATLRPDDPRLTGRMAPGPACGADGGDCGVG